VYRGLQQVIVVVRRHATAPAAAVGAWFACGGDGGVAPLSVELHGAVCPARTDCYRTNVRPACSPPPPPPARTQ